MNLSKRLRRLLAADAHGVVEALEDRSLLLKQHLREAELAVDRKRARLQTLEEAERRLTAEIERAERDVKALDEDVELALAGDKEELARFAVGRLLPRREALTALRRQAAQSLDERRRLEAVLASQERELEELSRRVRGAIASERERILEPAPAVPTVADEEIELELLRRRGAESGVGGEGTS
jgi:phage shock protein A